MELRELEQIRVFLSELQDALSEPAPEIEGLKPQEQVKAIQGWFGGLSGRLGALAVPTSTLAYPSAEPAMPVVVRQEAPPLPMEEEDFTPKLLPERIEWAKAALPSNRSDDCAWIRPASGTPYVYAAPCETDGSGADDGQTVTPATVDDFEKIFFTSSGVGMRLEPNVRQNDLVPYWTLDAANYCFAGQLFDLPLGSVRLVFDPAFNVVEDSNIVAPAGWQWMDDTTSYALPNTDVDTAGATVANTQFGGRAIRGTQFGGRLTQFLCCWMGVIPCQFTGWEAADPIPGWPIHSPAGQSGRTRDRDGRSSRRRRRGPVRS